MLEIIYRPTEQIGYFMLKSEFVLYLFIALCIGSAIGYFSRRNKVVKVEEDD